MKVRILMWLVIQNKLLTVGNLSKRNIRVGIFVCFAIDAENLCSIFLFIARLSALFRSLEKLVLLSKECLTLSSPGGLVGDRVWRRYKMIWYIYMMPTVWVLWNEEI